MMDNGIKLSNPGLKPAMLTLTPGRIILQSNEAHVRDPSGVLFHDGRYHCWPTRVKADGGSEAGYRGRVWHYSADSLAGDWLDCGPAVAPSPHPDAPDGMGTFTADAIREPEAEEWFLFYSAVPQSFTNERSVKGFGRTSLMVARSKGPDGPWERLPCNPVAVPGSSPFDWDGMRIDEAMPMVIYGEKRLYMRGVQFLGEAPFRVRQLPGLYLPEPAASWNARYRRHGGCPLTLPPGGVMGFESYAYFPGPDGLLHMLSVNPFDGPLDWLAHVVSADGLSWQHLEPVHLEAPGGYVHAPHPVWTSAVPGTGNEPVDRLVTQMRDVDGRLKVQLVAIRWQ